MKAAHDEGHKAHTVTHFFSILAQATSQKLGHPLSFVLAILLVIIWAAVGPIFKYSDTWQLVINTGTTIITFLMVFLIQNTQNRDMTMLQLKLDELIRANEGARDTLLNIEGMTEEELKRLKEKFTAIGNQSTNAEQLDEAKEELTNAAEGIAAAKDKIGEVTKTLDAETPG